MLIQILVKYTKNFEVFQTSSTVIENFRLKLDENMS